MKVRRRRGDLTISVRSKSKLNAACEDLTGRKFGRLTVKKFHSIYRTLQQWVCVCACGRSIVTRAVGLKNGHTTSCGCARGTHGMHKTREYYAWASMLQRTTNKKHRGWADYGGRGITVCARWLKFDNFLADMGKIPPGTSLDRIDNNKGYFPENCRFSTAAQQQRNTRSNAFLTFSGETLCVADWAKRVGLATNVLWGRVYKGKWPLDQALGFLPRVRGAKAQCN